VRYRLTFENGATGVMDDVAQRHFLRQAVKSGYPWTRVRGGHVLTMPNGSLAAMLREAIHGDSPTGVVLRDITVS